MSDNIPEPTIVQDNQDECFVRELAEFENDVSELIRESTRYPIVHYFDRSHYMANIPEVVALDLHRKGYIVLVLPNPKYKKLNYIRRCDWEKWRTDMMIIDYPDGPHK